MKKLFSLLLIVLFTAGCATLTTKVAEDADYIKLTTCTVIPDFNDPLKLSYRIAIKLRDLGFEVLDETKYKEADILVRFQYESYDEIIHRSFRRLQMSFVDNKTSKVIVQTNYVGKNILSSMKILDRVFTDIEKKLREHNDSFKFRRIGGTSQYID